MKKVLLSAVLLAAICLTIGAASWTDLFKISTWGRVVITPYAFSGDDSSVSASTFTGGIWPTIGVKIDGTSPSGKVGLVFNPVFCIDSDIGSYVKIPEIGGNAKAWVKPFDCLKLTSGWFSEDDFRGTVGTTEFASWLLPNSGKDEDAIFTRFRAALGAHFKIEPLAYFDAYWNKLMIEGAFGTSLASTGASNGDSRANRNIIDLDAADVYKRMQIGVGYWWTGVGFFRAQFIGNNRSQLRADYQNAGYYDGQYLSYGLSTSGDADVIEAAVKLTCINGLDLDVGAKLPLKYTADTSFTEYPALKPNAAVVTVDGDERIVQKPYCVSAAVNWEPWFFLPFGLTARVDASFGGTIEETGHHKIIFGSDLAVWILPSYRIIDELKVGIDFGMEIKQRDQWQQPIGKEIASKTEGSDYLDIGVGPWVELDVGGGRVRTGAMIMLPGSERWTWVSGNSTGYEFRQTFTGEPVVSFPISVTYSF